MGLAYLLGNHAEKNFDTAFELIKEASEEKYLPAMKKLAEIYRYNMNEEEGENLKKNKKHEKNQNDENAIKFYLLYLEELKEKYYRFRNQEVAEKLYDERRDIAEYCKSLNEMDTAEEIVLDNVAFMKEQISEYQAGGLFNDSYSDERDRVLATFHLKLAQCYRFLAWISFITNWYPDAADYYQDVIDVLSPYNMDEALRAFLLNRQEFCKDIYKTYKKIFIEKQIPSMIDGEYVYCLEFDKGAIPSEMNIGEGAEVDDMPQLSAVLCLGPGGSFYDTMKYWWKTYWGFFLSDEQAYLYTYVCANYVYQSAIGGMNGWKGYNAVFADELFRDYLAYASDFANGTVCAADGWEYENFKCQMRGTPGSLPNMAYRASCDPKPVPKPTQMNVTVSVTKDGVSSDPDNKISVENAKYGVYKASNNNKVGEITLTLPDPSDKTVGQGTTEITITESGKYYIQEIDPPYGFNLDEKKYPFTVYVAEQSLVSDCAEITIPARRMITLDATDTPNSMSFGVEIEKIKSASSYNLQGQVPPTLAGAQYTLFNEKDEKLQVVETTGNNQKATAEFNNIVKKGKYYIQETYNPSGWALDKTKYWFEADPEAAPDGMGELTPISPTATDTTSGFIVVSPRTLTLSHIEKEEGSGAFIFTKVDTEGNPLPGAEFELYLLHMLQTLTVMYMAVIFLQELMYATSPKCRPDISH